jgi:hypothetical protein
MAGVTLDGLRRAAVVQALFRPTTLQRGQDRSWRDADAVD